MPSARSPHPANRSHLSPVKTVAFHPDDGGLFMAVDQTNVVSFWSHNEWVSSDEVVARSAPTIMVDVSPSPSLPLPHTHITLACRRRPAKHPQHAIYGPSDYITSAAWVPEYDSVVTAGRRGHIYVFRNPVDVTPGNDDADAGDVRRTRLFSRYQRTLVRDLDAHDDAVWCLFTHARIDMSPDVRKLRFRARPRRLRASTRASSSIQSRGRSLSQSQSPSSVSTATSGASRGAAAARAGGADFRDDAIARMDREEADEETGKEGEGRSGRFSTSERASRGSRGSRASGDSRDARDSHDSRDSHDGRGSRSSRGSRCERCWEDDSEQEDADEGAEQLEPDTYIPDVDDVVLKSIVFSAGADRRLLMHNLLQGESKETGRYQQGCAELV